MSTRREMALARADAAAARRVLLTQFGADVLREADRWGLDPALICPPALTGPVPGMDAKVAKARALGYQYLFSTTQPAHDRCQRAGRLLRVNGDGWVCLSCERAGDAR